MTGELPISPVIIRLGFDAPIAIITALPESQLIKVRVEVEYDWSITPVIFRAGMKYDR